MRVKQAASHPKEKKVDYTVTSSILQMENAMYSVTMVPSAKLHGVTFRRQSSCYLSR